VRRLPLLLWLWTPVAQGGEIVSLEVSNAGNRYRVELIATLAQPREKMMHLITDYRLLKLVNPYVRESRPVPGATPPAQRVLMVSEGCLLLFCRKVRHTQDFTRRGWMLESVMVPSMSDFRSGWLRWWLELTADGNTRIRMQAEVEPAFWIPPLIGPPLLRHTLRKMAEETIAGLEQVSAAAR